MLAAGRLACRGLSSSTMPLCHAPLPRASRLRAATHCEPGNLSASSSGRRAFSSAVRERLRQHLSPEGERSQSAVGQPPAGLVAGTQGGRAELSVRGLGARSSGPGSAAPSRPLLGQSGAAQCSDHMHPSPSQHRSQWLRHSGLCPPQTETHFHAVEASSPVQGHRLSHLRETGCPEAPVSEADRCTLEKAGCKQFKEQTKVTLLEAEVGALQTGPERRGAACPRFADQTLPPRASAVGVINSPCSDNWGRVGCWWLCQADCRPWVGW